MISDIYIATRALKHIITITEITLSRGWDFPVSQVSFVYGNFQGNLTTSMTLDDENQSFLFIQNNSTKYLIIGNKVL